LLLRRRRDLVGVLPAAIRAEKGGGHHHVLRAHLVRGFEVGTVAFEAGHDLFGLRAFLPAFLPRPERGLLRVGAGPFRIRSPERREQLPFPLFAVPPWGGIIGGGKFLFFFFFLLSYFSFFFFFSLRVT